MSPKSLRKRINWQILWDNLSSGRRVRAKSPRPDDRHLGLKHYPPASTPSSSSKTTLSTN
ncbi:hypothetical protein FRB91_011056 [Serendipita sp. 411]|nr:hypothetical protein FRC18_010516 [Serendipita sp. 400]KAG8861021.1 hypothetical protein FRB91_011056 [Serendipita sp. 411]